MTEKERLEIQAVADDLGCLMTQAHNEGCTYEQINQFASDPRSVINIDAGNEALQRIAALIYVHTELLQFTNYDIRMSGGKYEVEVKFSKTPF